MFLHVCTQYSLHMLMLSFRFYRFPKAKELQKCVLIPQTYGSTGSSELCKAQLMKIVTSDSKRDNKNVKN